MMRFRPEVRAAFARLVASGWTDACASCIRASASRFLGLIAKCLERDAGRRIDHLLLGPSSPRASSVRGLIVKSAAGTQAITRPPGWKSRTIDSLAIASDG